MKQSPTSPSHVDATMDIFHNAKLPLAVVVAGTRWDEPPRMRHQVTRQLMRWCNVVFIEYFCTGQRGHAEGQWRRVGERLAVYTPTDRFRAPPRLQANDPFSHARTNRRYAAEIGAAVKDLPGTPRLLFNFVYDFPELMRIPTFDRRCYICVDEFPRMQRGKASPNPLKAWYQGHLFQHYENQVARRADRCFTPHYPLRSKLKRVNPKVDMLFHAHEWDAITRPRKNGNGRIDVAFAGYINYRLPYDWLDAIERERDMKLHLIGPMQDTRYEKLLRHPNVCHVAPLIGTAFREKLLEMDVLLMPYSQDSPEVRALTTNSKIFQYVASGRPIVMSDLPHYIKLPEGVIYRAKTAEEFVEQIRRAYHEDCDEYRQLRARIAAENTWDKRGDMLLSIIDRDLNGLLTRNGIASPREQGSTCLAEAVHV